MTAYSKKKPHIIAYRRRKSAANYVKKLSKIAQEMNEKDLVLLNKKLDSLHIDIGTKLGWYDAIPKRGERYETPAQKLKESLTRNIIPIPRCSCPVCHRLGFLFSPNLDLRGRDFKRFILHIEWPSMKTEFCQIPPLKTNLTWVEGEPAEGIFVLRS